VEHYILLLNHLSAHVVQIIFDEGCSWSLVFDCSIIFFSQAVADIIRTTLGPRSMLKMLLDAGGGMPKACL
jgi:hypothetical protein